MAYLGRGWLAILYIAVGIIAGFGAIWLSSSLSASYVPLVFLRIVGAVHGYLAARTIGSDRRFPWYSHWYSLFLLFAVGAYAIAMLIRSMLFQPFTIPASSMMPTLQVGDYIFVEKYAYGYARYSFPFGLGPKTRLFGKSPERGDVIVFRTATDPDTDYVKRLIGLPGDHIQIRSGITYLNGQPLPREPQGTVNKNGKSVPFFDEKLPSGRSYLVAEMSNGSRGDNTAEWLVPDGHYFVLGDNRDNSLDSRFDMGFIPDENVVGKVSIVFFNATNDDRELIWVK